ncbi:MAG TPA: hypothetical protein VGJ55_08710 [Pyrinomonadaceae bacterium]
MGYKIRWTTHDLYVESALGTDRIWASFVEEGFQDFTASYIHAKRPNRKIEDCTYERRLTLLSVVGALVSFEDEYADFCGGAHPSEDYRFTTLDLSKSGGISYVRQESTPMMNIDMADPPKKIVKLTDYFAGRDILRALLADRVIQTALDSFDLKPPPRSLRELSDLLATQGYVLGSSGLGLPPDYLTRFAFHHLEGDKVAVRLSLSSASVANQSEREQIGLLLPVPEKLAAPFRSASTGRQGFLMKDTERIARGKATVFNFPE